MNDTDEQYWINKLELLPHPEGGHFRETYRSALRIPQAALRDSFGGDRHASTAIYFLLARTQCSAFHRIRSDELWFFHAGNSMRVHVIDTSGNLQSLCLGPNPEAGDAFQVTVPAGCWFAAEVVNKKSFGLCSCTVAPGFDFEDFDLADPNRLAEQFPQHTLLIHKMAGNKALS